MIVDSFSCKPVFLFTRPKNKMFVLACIYYIHNKKLSMPLLKLIEFEAIALHVYFKSL